METKPRFTLLGALGGSPPTICKFTKSSSPPLKCRPSPWNFILSPIFIKMAFSSKPARWISIIRHHRKGLLTVPHFLQDDSSNKSRKLYYRLTSSLFHYIHAAIFLPVLIFTNAGVSIFRVDLFLQMTETLSQNTLKNLEPHFDFVFHVQSAENQEICRIAKFHTGQNIVT